MHPSKVPEQDGLHALFFQSYWDIVGDEVFALINKFWEGNRGLEDINTTNIVLILKTNDPCSITQYRPIGLFNVLYKIIS